jgi:hypothetical protein
LGGVNASVHEHFKSWVETAPQREQGTARANIQSGFQIRSPRALLILYTNRRGSDGVYRLQSRIATVKRRPQGRLCRDCIEILGAVWNER